MKQKNFFVGVLTMAVLASCGENSGLMDNEQGLNALTRSYEVALSDEDGEKIETRADKDSIQAMMNEYVTAMMNRTAVAKEKVMRTAYSAQSDLVGVLKVGSCGNYKELIISVDCEDRRGKSSTSGNVGDSNVDGNENVHLHFCLVEATRYYPGGVLLVNRTPSCPRNLQRIVVRSHDTEDGNEKNRVESTHPDYNTNEGISKWLTQVGRNVTLAWGFPIGDDRVYPVGPVSKINYGLLSGLSASTGTIYFDDEDRNNKNWLQLWSGETFQKDLGEGLHVSYGIEANKNTTYNVSVSTDSKFWRNNIYYAYPR